MNLVGNAKSGCQAPFNRRPVYWCETILFNERCKFVISCSYTYGIRDKHIWVGYITDVAVENKEWEET